MQHRLTPSTIKTVLLSRIRGNGEVIKREEFEQRKEAADQARQARLNKKPRKLASQGKQVEEFPLLQVSHCIAHEGKDQVHVHCTQSAASLLMQGEDKIRLQ